MTVSHTRNFSKISAKLEELAYFCGLLYIPCASTKTLNTPLIFTQSTRNLLVSFQTGGDLGLNTYSTSYASVVDESEG
jgi:hypothetical protein